MPICRPEHPRFASGAERQVWDVLREQLNADDILLANIRVTDRKKDYEADIVVLMPDAGACRRRGQRRQRLARRRPLAHDPGGLPTTVDPVDQARGARYALRDYVERDPRWRRSDRRRIRWAHAVALPNTELPEDFSCPDCPRWMVADRTDTHLLANRLRDIPRQQESANAPLAKDDALDIVEILTGRGRSQRDVVADAEERDFDAERLTQEQAVILGATRLLNRVEVRGGAGSGKTWLAIEQARRLTGSGKDVAVLCYSRGLAAYLNRVMLTIPKRERPAYVGEFHKLGQLWGAEPGSDDDSEYWEDFADAWWPAVLASLRDEETGGLYVFSDEGQRVFARYGQPPVPLVPLMLDHNMRNTKQIAATFNSLAPMRMKLFGGDGPAVRFVECEPREARRHRAAHDRKSPPRAGAAPSRQPGRVLGVLLGHRAGVLRPRPRVQGTRTSSGGPRVEREQNQRAFP